MLRLPSLRLHPLRLRLLLLLMLLALFLLLRSLLSLILRINRVLLLNILVLCLLVLSAVAGSAPSSFRPPNPPRKQGASLEAAGPLSRTRLANSSRLPVFPTSARVPALLRRRSALQLSRIVRVALDWERLEANGTRTPVVTRRMLIPFGTI
jgi:hypothetical protein